MGKKGYNQCGQKIGVFIDSYEGKEYKKYVPQKIVFRNKAQHNSQAYSVCNFSGF